MKIRFFYREPNDIVTMELFDDNNKHVPFIFICFVSDWQKSYEELENLIIKEIEGFKEINSNLYKGFELMLEQFRKQFMK